MSDRKRKTKKGKASRKKQNEIDQTKKYKTKKKHKMNPTLKKIIKIFFVMLVLLCIIGAGVFAGLFFGLFGDDFKIEKKDLELSNLNSVVKDKDGNIIANLSGEENRRSITMAEMPAYLPKAFVSIEDERFYTHHGVDFKRTLGATVTYIFNRGSSSYGGSTITQQLIKNLTKQKDDSGIAGMLRKVKEMSKARQVEQMISKDQILELYLNIIFMGDTAYGVEVASQYYFSKSAKDLDLAECAFLAGINHSPNRYNPFDTSKDQTKVAEQIKKRSKTVLMKMKELGAVTDEEEYNAAVAKVDAGLPFVEGNISTSEASYSFHTAAAIQQVKRELMEKNNWSSELADFNLRTKGYVIYSTQDSTIQARMEEEFRKDKTYITTAKKLNKDGIYEKSQAAMAVIDHHTGYVMGTVGALGSDANAGGMNRATQGWRQTGSCMKPISVVAPGLEKGTLTAGSVYVDTPTRFGTYNPKNYNNYKGPITIRDAIESSQNIPQLKAITDLGPTNAVKFLKEIGFAKIYLSSDQVYTLDGKLKSDENPSLALGGLTDGATPLEMAAAYAMIANDGEYIEPTFYTKVEDGQGNVIIEKQQERKQVMSAQNAYIMKSVLTEPVVGASGTAKYCRISGIDVAAKTGTTNDDIDRWLCGFTPYYAAATWYGFDTPSEVKFGGSNPAGKLWAAIMKDIHNGKDKAKFEQPAGIQRVTICKDTGLLPGEGCTNTYTEYFSKGTAPKERCDGRITVTICTDTGKVANEYCVNKEEKFYTVKPPKEKTGKWTSDYQGRYDELPTETCNIHKKPEPPANNTTGNTTTGNNTTGNTTGGNTTTGNNTTGNTTGGNTTTENTTGNSTTGNNTGNSTTGNTTSGGNKKTGNVTNSAKTV